MSATITVGGVSGQPIKSSVLENNRTKTKKRKEKEEAYHFGLITYVLFHTFILAFHLLNCFTSAIFLVDFTVNPFLWKVTFR